MKGEEYLPLLDETLSNRWKITEGFHESMNPTVTDSLILFSFDIQNSLFDILFLSFTRILPAALKLSNIRGL